MSSTSSVHGCSISTPWPFRCALRCRCSWLGSGLDWFTHRAVDVGAAIHTTRRGEPLPINQALNRPRAKLGLDLSAWMAIVFVCVTVFLVGFRMLAILAFPTLAGGAWLIVRNHPKMFQLWGLNLSQKSYYDPRKY
jgi:type IV secretory pathway VirB3-like protein